MHLDFGLLADFAYTDDRNKFYILGEFRYVFARQIPAVHKRMVVAMRITADVVELRGGEPLRLQIELTDADGNPVIPRSPAVPLGFIPLGQAAPSRHIALLTLEVENLVLPQYGDYSFHVLVNNNHLGTVPFTVVQVTPPHPA
jgi:uncharacterized protein DUF6941